MNIKEGEIHRVFAVQTVFRQPQFYEVVEMEARFEDGHFWAYDSFDGKYQWWVQNWELNRNDAIELAKTFMREEIASLNQQIGRIQKAIEELR